MNYSLRQIELAIALASFGISYDKILRVVQLDRIEEMKKLGMHIEFKQGTNQAKPTNQQ